ncbi:hypothetical protein WGP40_08515 [Brachymonas sp. G13]|nr:hypothetical protein [Brachymonas sp. J145]MEE1653605.1 hypothetical protein [Brachymonas sp. J145]
MKENGSSMTGAAALEAKAVHELSHSRDAMCIGKSEKNPPIFEKN